MSFSFDSIFDEETFGSFRKLMEYNNAMFKSLNQANFFKKSSREIKEFEVKNYGLNSEDIGLNMIIINASTRWADYGSRSVIPVMWAFVFDQFGIKKEYKLGIYGNMRDGAGVEPKKTKLNFSRPVDAVLPQFEEIQKKAVSESPFVNSEFIGDIGERISFKGVVVSVREFQGTAFHYHDSGMRVQTIINVDGNQVVYWNSLKGAKAGDEVEFSAAVKEFTVYKEVKQTVISRATKVVIKKLENV